MNKPIVGRKSPKAKIHVEYFFVIDGRIIPKIIIEKMNPILRDATIQVKSDKSLSNWFINKDIVEPDTSNWNPFKYKWNKFIDLNHLI